MTDSYPSTTWQLRAACRGWPLELFITDYEGYDGDKVNYPSHEVRKFCERCPVRVECFAWAIANDEWGIWGGTTRYQRSQLKRVTTRRRCPACAEQHVIRIDQHEVCMSCGMSWRRFRRTR